MAWLSSKPSFIETEHFDGVLLPEFWGFTFYGIQQEKRKADLIQSERMHRRFIENQPVGLCRTTIGDGGRLIMANTAMARMFGYDSVEQLMESKTEQRYKHPEDRTQMLETLIQNDRVRAMAREGRKRDGSEMIVSMTMNLFRNGDGNPIEIEGTIEDTTARRKAELSL